MLYLFGRMHISSRTILLVGKNNGFSGLSMVNLYNVKIDEKTA